MSPEFSAPEPRPIGESARKGADFEPRVVHVDERQPALTYGHEVTPPLIRASKNHNLLRMHEGTMGP